MYTMNVLGSKHNDLELIVVNLSIPFIMNQVHSSVIKPMLVALLLLL